MHMSEPFPQTAGRTSGEIEIVDEKFVSVDRAAELLHTSTSTIWRWIKQGRLPAYRFGYRRVLIKQADLGQVLEPTNRQGKRKGGSMDERDRPLGAQERRQMEMAVAQARQLQAKLLERRKGKLFPSSSAALDVLREERTRNLQ